MEAAIFILALAVVISNIAWGCYCEDNVSKRGNFSPNHCHLDAGRIYQTLGGIKLENGSYAVTLRGGSSGELIGCVMNEMPPALFRYDGGDKITALEQKPQLTRVDQKV